MLPYFILKLCEVEIMEKENKDIMIADVASMIKDDKTTDSSWIYFTLLMMLFAFPMSGDTRTREELAELKGKVSVLEKLAVRGN